MIRVRCKMICVSVTQRFGHKAVYDDPTAPQKVTRTVRAPFYDAAFSAVYGEQDPAGVLTDGQRENKKFWEATPSGEFKVATVTEMPWEPGKAYYIDVVEAPE